MRLLIEKDGIVHDVILDLEAAMDVYSDDYMDAKAILRDIKVIMEQINVKRKTKETD